MAVVLQVLHKLNPFVCFTMVFSLISAKQNLCVSAKILTAIYQEKIWQGYLILSARELRIAPKTPLILYRTFVSGKKYKLDCLFIQNDTPLH